MKQERIFVVSAHALDFLWRCSGTIAQYAKAGSPIKVVCLSYGERGESNPVWKKHPGITEDEVKKIKRAEAEQAAAVLGAEIQFMDYGDHPMIIGRKEILELTDLIMDFQPTILLTHMKTDILNPDHAIACDTALKALRCAHAYGTVPDKSPCKLVRVYHFEPAQPDVQGYIPDTFVDITDVMDIRDKAMEMVASQSYLPAFYKERASYRGNLARRHSENEEIKFAETFIRMNPHIGKELG